MLWKCNEKQFFFFGGGGCVQHFDRRLVCDHLSSKQYGNLNLSSWVRYGKSLFRECQTVTGRNVQVVKFLVFLIGLIVQLVTSFSRSFDLRSSIWLKVSVKIYTRRKQQLNYFCVVYFSRRVDIQYISASGFFIYLFIFIFYCECRLGVCVTGFCVVDLPFKWDLRFCRLWVLRLSSWHVAPCRMVR
jgi:hypothetical protein